MVSLEEQFEAACAAGDIPGVVLVACDVEGKFKYEKAFGQKSPTENMDLDATFIMASCTKLMTSIAGLQCMERGQVGLDDDLGEVISELKDCEILTGFKEGTEEPILKRAENKITLRHLLTHTSGFGNESLDPLLRRWRKSRGESERFSKKGKTLMQFASKPLLFEPGTSWAYGASTDWVGILVMRLNEMSLEAYMQKYIWDPLGIENITFHQEMKPEVKKNLVTLTMRGEQGVYAVAAPTEAKVRWIDDKLYDDPIADEFGSGGAIGSAVEYMKILQSICADDGRLLMSETIDEMFTPQLSDEYRKSFDAFLNYLANAKQFSGHKPGSKIGHGLAGMVMLEDMETGLKTGSLSWSGLPNLLWTIDSEAGLSLMYASNVVPFGDRKSHEMQQIFEKEMYKRFSEIQGV